MKTDWQRNQREQNHGAAQAVYTIIGLSLLDAQLHSFVILRTLRNGLFFCRRYMFYMLHETTV